MYRPKKLPRVLRRQLPVVRLLSAVALIGLLAMAVTWRNLSHERLMLDVGQQQAQVELLSTEIRHLDGQIKNETALGRVSKWARDKRGWKNTSEPAGVVHLNESELTPAAREEAHILSGASHE
jgi:cell division protein FtsL